jgi:hypothetical protein
MSRQLKIANHKELGCARLESFMDLIHMLFEFICELDGDERRTSETGKRKTNKLKKKVQ